MESLLKFIENLVSTYGVSGGWLAACFGVVSVGVSIFYIIKGILLLQEKFKQPSDGASKDDLEELKRSLQDDNKYILKLLEGVHERLKRDVFDRLVSIETSHEHLREISRQLEAEIEKVGTISDQIKDMQDEDLKTSATILHDVDALVVDTKIQYQELQRQVNALQVDLASLHGTLIGMNTQRSRLK
jgi:hypothetical protein